MNRYAVYGGCLRSELPFPELSAAAEQAADWTVRVGEPPAPRVPMRPRGVRRSFGWTLRLSGIPGGQRLELGKAGTFDLVSGGSEIVWYPGAGVPPGFVRSVILGPVMALSLRERGLLCLHGSAVALEGKVIAFLAPQRHGKSTLAFALAAAGARLVTDDLVAVEPGDPPIVLPGTHGVRLRNDTAGRLNGRNPGTLVSGPKALLTDLPPRWLAWDALPLGALYLLRPLPPETARNEIVERVRLSPAEAVARVAHQKTLKDSLVGSAAAAESLRRVARVVRDVPVYRVRLLRDLHRLPEVAERIRSWHGAPVGAAVGSAP